MRPNLNKWRQSASVIIAAKSPFTPKPPYNYELLCLRRSSKSQVFPNSYVFPGGNLSQTDSSMQWLEIFKKSGYQLESFTNLYPKENIPPILKNKEADKLPTYLALRICAIRETFEECGILIAKSNKSSTENSSNKWASYIGGHQILEWQHKVHERAEEFLNLCSHFDIYPDVWALKNWSNWTTPAVLPAKYDTVFFITTFSQMPPVSVDDKEISNLTWFTPDEYAIKSGCGKISSPPPQYYEIARLRNFENIEILSEFSDMRSEFGCEQYFPFIINTPGGQYFIYPGDSLYPENVYEAYGAIEKAPKLGHLPESKTKNRLLIFGENLNKKLFIENLTPKDKHLAPKPCFQSQL